MAMIEDPRLDLIIDMLSEDRAIARAIRQDHEGRIAKLELWRAYILGAFAVVGTFLAYLTKYIHP